MDLPAVTTPPGTAAPEPAPSPAARVAWVVSGDHVLVVLQGDVDVAAEPALRAVGPAVAAQDLPVVVDASRVDFMDCTGLRAVLELGRCTPGLAVRRPSPAATAILRLTGELGREGDAGAGPSPST